MASGWHICPARGCGRKVVRTVVTRMGDSDDDLRLLAMLPAGLGWTPNPWRHRTEIAADAVVIPASTVSHVFCARKHRASRAVLATGNDRAFAVPLNA